MSWTIKRATLASEVRLEGRGLHGGEPVTLRLVPADRGGITFVNASGDRIAALPENVVDTRRSTSLDGVRTIEHLMSALAGLGVTDVDVVLEQGDEMPGTDGSAGPFVSALKQAGLRPLNAEERPSLFARVFTVDEENIETKIAIAAGKGHWRYAFDTGDRWPGRQESEWLHVHEVYEKEIAPARTLVFEEEIQLARQAGLGKGLDETSVLAIGQSGYVNQARFADEPARHKLLDLIGDLALAGVPLECLDVAAERSGHRLNVRAAQRLRESLGAS